MRIDLYRVEHPAEGGVTLSEERVAVKRRPVERSASDTRDEAFQDRTIDVTTHGEEPDIAKETRLKEEVSHTTRNRSTHRDRPTDGRSRSRTSCPSLP